MQSNHDPITNIKDVETLASNPIQMATRILTLEKHSREWKIGTDPQRRAGLLEQLRIAIQDSQSIPEQAHQDADDLLLAFINDEEISTLYGQVKKYYT